MKIFDIRELLLLKRSDAFPYLGGFVNSKCSSLVGQCQEIDH